MMTIRDEARGIWYSVCFFAEAWAPKPFTNGALVGYGLVEYDDFRGGHDWTCCVIHLDSGCPVGSADTKADAIAFARRNLDVCASRLPELFAEYKAIRLSETARLAKLRDSRSSIPKRRREIFEKSEGRCHYCATPLTLDGKWHIEHMQPKALLGPNDKSNLVASCVSCNMKKRDMTAEEFIAKRQA